MSRIQRFVQNCIADPLQYAGIPLEWQVRVCVVVILLGWAIISLYHAAAREWGSLAMTSLIVPIYLWSSIDFSLGYQKSQQSGSWFAVFWMVALVIDCLVVVSSGMSLRNLAEASVSGGNVLRWFLMNCKKRPPRGSFKFAMDSV